MKALPHRALIRRRTVAEEQVHRVSGGLKFRCQHLSALYRSNGKGDQRRRNIPVHEGAGHGVLAADGCSTQIHLRLQRPQQRGKGLSPAKGFVS